MIVQWSAAVADAGDSDGAAPSGEPPIEALEEAPRGRFGAFSGVFTPSILTILGVVMYMRLGWVTGQAGLGVASPSSSWRTSSAC